MTYSILGRDSATGQGGGAIQSAWFSSGTGVVWAEAGVGAVASQAIGDPAFGHLGLQMLAAGSSPHHVVDLAASVAGLECSYVDSETKYLDVGGRVRGLNAGILGGRVLDNGIVATRLDRYHPLSKLITADHAARRHWPSATASPMSPNAPAQSATVSMAATRST